MKNSRKIISIIMCVTIALSFFSVMACTTLKYTMFNKSFVAKFLITEDLKTSCNDQLNLKFEVLEKKSNIPSSVFKQVHDDKPIDQIMELNVENFFIGRDTSLNTEDVVNYFYEICTAYLDENNAKYEEDDIRNVAVEAAKIYSDSVGFSNTQHLKLFIDEVQQDMKNVMIYALGFLVIACILMYMMYSDPKEAFKYMSESVIGSGFSGIMVGIISLIMRYGMDLPISPDAYLEAFNHLGEIGYGVFIGVGAFITVVGILLAVIVDRAIRTEKNRKDSRFFKRLDNI